MARPVRAGPNIMNPGKSCRSTRREWGALQPQIGEIHQQRGQREEGDAGGDRMPPRPCCALAVGGRHDEALVAVGVAEVTQVANTAVQIEQEGDRAVSPVHDHGERRSRPAWARPADAGDRAQAMPTPMENSATPRPLPTAFPAPERRNRRSPSTHQPGRTHGTERKTQRKGDQERVGGDAAQGLAQCPPQRARPMPPLPPPPAFRRRSLSISQAGGNRNDDDIGSEQEKATKIRDRQQFQRQRNAHIARIAPGRGRPSAAVSPMTAGTARRMIRDSTEWWCWRHETTGAGRQAAEHVLFSSGEEHGGQGEIQQVVVEDLGRVNRNTPSVRRKPA